MGMESYYVTVTDLNVRIIRDKEYWKLEGKSKKFVKEVEQYFESLEFMSKKSGRWIYDSCIEVIIISQEGIFQGIDFKGCLSYFIEGLKICFNFINKFSRDFLSVQVFILNEKVELDSFEIFCSKAEEKYQDQILIFKKQYNNLSLKATCGGFYKEIDKRNRWYYKMFHKD